MATLRSKLRMGSGLASTSQEEAQSLAAKAERSAAPSTPMETAVIGGNPDVAKMSGTPNQQVSALRTTIQQSNNLSDVQRRDQPRMQLTAQEQAAKAKEQKIQGLGGLQSRVQNLTKQLLTQGQQAAAPTQMQVDPSKLAAIPPENQAEMGTLLGKLGTNTATPADILRLNQLSGKTNIADQLTPDQLKANFLSAGQAVGTNLAQATADQALVSSLPAEELGFADMAELASTLGVDEAELGGMTIKQLQDQSRKLFDAEFEKVSNLENQANNPNLGPAERAEARKALRDAGATGIREAESSVDKLADQIADADVVKIGNEEMPVADMLKDEYISGLAARYLDAEDGDPFVEDFKASEPELADWFDDNREILKQATAELDADVAAFSELQNTNKKAAQPVDGPALSDDLMSAIFPDWGKLRDSTYDLATEAPVLALLQDPNVPSSTRANTQAALTTVADTSPQLTQSFAKLSLQDLDRMGATSGPGNSRWNTTLSYLKDTANVNTIVPEQPDTIATFVLGPGTTYGDLVKLANDNNAMANSGLFGTSPMPAELSQLIRSGDSAAVATYLQQKFTKPTNAAALVSSVPFSVTESANNAKNYAAQSNELFDIVGNYFQNATTLDSNATRDIAATKGPQSLEKVYVSQLKSKMTPTALQEIQSTYTGSRTPQLDANLKTAQYYPVSTMQSLALKPAGKLNPTEVKKLSGTLSQLKSQLKNTNKDTNPLEYAMLNKLVAGIEVQVKGHVKNLADQLKQVLVSEVSDKRKLEEADRLLGGNYPGASEGRKEALAQLGINDEKMLKKLDSTLGSSNIASMNSLDLGGNSIKEQVDFLMKAPVISKAVKVANKPAAAAQKAAGKLSTALKKSNPFG